MLLLFQKKPIEEQQAFLNAIFFKAVILKQEFLIFCRLCKIKNMSADFPQRI